MPTSYFESKFGKNPREFKSIQAVNRFVEEKIGHKLEIKEVHSNICTSRGSIIPVKEIDADRVLEAAVNKKCA